MRPRGDRDRSAAEAWAKRDDLTPASKCDTAIATLRKAHEIGNRYFDTAPLYGHDRSDIRSGQALSHSQVKSAVLTSQTAICGNAMINAKHASMATTNGSAPT